MKQTILKNIILLFIVLNKEIKFFDVKQVFCRVFGVYNI